MRKSSSIGRIVVLIALMAIVVGFGSLRGTTSAFPRQSSNWTNEQYAVALLQNLHSANVAYQTTHGGPGHNFAANLRQLGLASSNVAFRELLLQLDDQQAWKGYHVASYQASLSPSGTATYEVLLAPVVPTGITRTGNDQFRVDETGVIRHSAAPNIAATSTSDPIE